MREDDTTDTQPAGEESPFREGRRFSLWEAALWLTGISIVFATPSWFGTSSLTVIFYATLIALSWRFSKAMPLPWPFSWRFSFLSS